MITTGNLFVLQNECLNIIYANNLEKHLVNTDLYVWAIVNTKWISTLVYYYRYIVDSQYTGSNHVSVLLGFFYIVYKGL